MRSLQSLTTQMRLFEKEAHAILSRHESARSRVILLEDTYNQLSGLTLKQDQLFRQALRCVENSLFRAAHVMAWAGFMDLIEEKLASNNFKQLKSVRPNWKFSTVEDLRDEFTEHSIIEAAKEAELCSKSEMKALHGLLNKRNECAHPSDYFPGLNESLGYISELLKRVETLKRRTL